MRQWKAFCDLVRENGEGGGGLQKLKTFNKFYARYRLAKKFQSIEASGYSAKAMRGYSAGIRLLMSYSAAELLGDAIDEKITNWDMRDAELAKFLRKTISIVAESDENFSSKSLKNSAKAFVEGDDNVRVAATVLRVMVAHGTFTPTGADALTSAGAKAIENLSDALLEACDNKFASWLAQADGIVPITGGSFRRP
ncbi:hypothetical protein [Falsiroseomonas stagni]|uniref:hypothetical protein n=1 Tax=Falsiroseomonas stagni TaxID=484882 RepID=UPI0011137341|nr:hypothetical protein [Falsiroseomonas stagni]